MQKYKIHNVKYRDALMNKYSQVEPTSAPTPSSPISLYWGSSSSGFLRLAMAALLAAAAWDNASWRIYNQNIIRKTPCSQIAVCGTPVKIKHIIVVILIRNRKSETLKDTQESIKHTCTNIYRLQMIYTMWWLCDECVILVTVEQLNAELSW